MYYAPILSKIEIEQLYTAPTEEEDPVVALQNRGVANDTSVNNSTISALTGDQKLAIPKAQGCPKTRE